MKEGAIWQQVAAGVRGADKKEVAGIQINDNNKIFYLKVDLLWKYT